jgi:hypothetical protein
MATYQVSTAQVNGRGPASDSYSTAQAQNIATPYATLDKALSVMVNGDNIVLNGQAISPQIYNATTVFAITRGNSVISCVEPAGAILRANGAQARVANIAIPAAQQIVLQNLVFDAQNLSTRCVDTGNNNSHIIYQDCTFKDGVTDLAKGNSDVAFYEYRNPILSGSPTTAGITHASMGNGGILHVDNVSGNLTMPANLGGAVYAQATTQNATVRVKIGALHQTNGATARAGLVTLVGIEHHEVLMMGKNGPEAILDGAANAGPAAVNIRGNGSITQRGGQIHDLNIANLCGVGGYDVLVGSDSSAGAGSDYTISQTVIKRCKSRGLASNPTRHGYIVGWQNGSVIDEVEATEAYINAIQKECHGDLYIIEPTVNMGVNNGSAGGVYSKGNQNGSVVCLAKVLLTTGNLNRAFYSGYNDVSGTPDGGSKFIANSVWSNDVVSKIAAVGTPGVPADTSTAKFVLNNYALAGVTGTPWTVGSSTSYADLASWSVGQELSATADVPTKRTPAFHASRFRASAVAKISEIDPCLAVAMGL